MLYSEELFPSVEDSEEEEESDDEDASSCAGDFSSAAGFSRRGEAVREVSSSELELDEDEDTCLLFLFRDLRFAGMPFMVGGIVAKATLHPTMSKRKLAALQDGTEPKYFYTGEISNMVSQDPATLYSPRRHCSCMSSEKSSNPTRRRSTSWKKL